MRRVSVATMAWLLEMYALALAILHVPGGVYTDEAKYLLNIPYPHPPLVRTLMAFTAPMENHEFFWRFLLASLLVQSVWFIVDLGQVLTRPRRLALVCAWLFSAALILQAGTIVMAVLAALFGLIFVWYALHPKHADLPPLLALLWLASLFTVYQSILYAPVVLYAVARSKRGVLRTLLYVGLPVLLLVLYSLSNPFALASMSNASLQDAPLPAIDRFIRIAWIWVISGSLVVSLAGTIGILTSSRWDLVAAFGLTFGFVILTSQYYYAILLLPLFIGGTFVLFCRRRLRPGAFIVSQVLCSMVLIVAFPPSLRPTHARSVMRQLIAQGITGPVLIDGPFGHEWQYESPVPILRFSDALSGSSEQSAQAFVCTKLACDDDVNLDEWVRLPDAPIPVWLRR